MLPTSTPIIIIILIIIIYIYFYDQINNLEGYYVFGGENAADDQYFYDKLFDDVVYIPNKYVGDYPLNDIDILGIDKCLQECKGKCVEFGITGNAYCFASDWN